MPKAASLRHSPIKLIHLFDSPNQFSQQDRCKKATENNSVASETSTDAMRFVFCIAKKNCRCQTSIINVIKNDKM